MKAEAVFQPPYGCEPGIFGHSISDFPFNAYKSVTNNNSMEQALLID